MCGIVGVFGKNDISKKLMSAIEHLEYRGYDSSGLSIFDGNKIKTIRKVGKIENLRKAFEVNKISGNFGIAHTRWATHGKVVENNAHPHQKNGIHVVHNGMIENFFELKNELKDSGFEFESETDTEIIPMLIYNFINEGLSDIDAVFATIEKIKGSFAIALLIEGEDKIIATKRGSPIVLGVGEGEFFVSSDILGICEWVNSFCYLEDDDVAIINNDGIKIYSNEVFDKNNILSNNSSNNSRNSSNISSNISNDTSSDTSSDTSGDTSSDTSSEISSEASNETSGDTSSETSSEASSETSNDNLNKILDNALICSFTKRIAVNRDFLTNSLKYSSSEKNGFQHHMLKEIFEQPNIIRKLSSIKFPDFDWQNVLYTRIVGCGSAYIAGCVARYWLEKNSNVRTHVEIASEFRYLSPCFSENEIGILISQSGETIDTLKSINIFELNKVKMFGILNVVNSSIGRLVDYILHSDAGPEIGVATTKAFLAQLMILFKLSLHIQKEKTGSGSLNKKEKSYDFEELASAIEQLLKTEDYYIKAGSFLAKKTSVLYLGRGINAPIALEGALKLKEISYIHAEGYPAGEMKHGPIALLDENVPVVFIIPDDDLFLKSLSNLQQVIARRATAIVISSEKGIKDIFDNIDSNKESIFYIKIPTVDPEFYPFLCAISVQLLAYHTALIKGTDIDKPRNLAKSVTVE